MREMVAILGFGGHGQDIADIAVACKMFPLPYDDGANTYAKTSTVGDQLYVVGVNDPATRRSLAVGSRAARLVHPTATVSRSAIGGPGVVVGANTTIGPGTVLGAHVHVGAGCTITRTSVGAYTTIAPGVHIAGDVQIGEECFLGVGAVVRNLITIGDRAVIGAGAVVVRNVADGETVVSRQLVATAT